MPYCLLHWSRSTEVAKQLEEGWEQEEEGVLPASDMTFRDLVYRLSVCSQYGWPWSLLQVQL